VLAMPELQKKLEVQGVEPMPLTPEQFDVLIREEVALNLKIAKDAGVTYN